LPQYRPVRLRARGSTKGEKRETVTSKQIIGYASRTGTRRNLAVLRDNGWRLLVSATGVHRTEGFRYALDNGAWSAYQRGTPFDHVAFMRLVGNLGRDADFIVIPDIVEGGERSLEFSRAWIPRLAPIGTKLLLAVQDGIPPGEVEKHLASGIGIFVGGSTEWKLATMPMWGRLARSWGEYLHVGRVNSVKRINLCKDAGADSFDGTSATRYAATVQRLTNATRQQTLF
jgi:hypothetical protein